MPAKYSRQFFSALLLCSFGFCSAAVAQESPSGSERFLFDAVNRERTQQGIPALKWDANLAAAARLHAKKMVEHNALSHQFSGEPELKTRLRDAGARFSRAAENVAEAAEVSILHVSWMNSLPHQANILNPKMNAIGIAVEQRGTQYFAVQDFSAAIGAMTRAEQEKKVAQLLAARGLRVTGDSEDARKACDSDGRIAGPHPRAISHFEAPDLDQLPEELLKMIKQGSFHTAAVGACSADDSAGFSRFRIAVLLY